MKRFGLIGYPAAHSLSPALFRAGYSGRYSYDIVESDNFTEAYGIFLDRYDGVNITAPFKEKALEKADILSPECRLIGATNLLVKSDEGIKAYNSDYYGIALSIMTAVRQSHSDENTAAVTSAQALPPRPSKQQMLQEMSGKGETALVVGAGGAGKAAAVAAASLGLKTTLMNRTMGKAERIASELPELKFNVLRTDEFLEAFFDSDIIIYTLPMAIEGIDEISGRIRQYKTSHRHDESETKRKYILEANYRDPAIKSIADDMDKYGMTYIPGEQWLLYQAYAGYDLFTGETPSLSDMAEVISSLSCP